MSTTKITFVCSTCGSDEVHKDASAYWDNQAQRWALSEPLSDHNYCAQCDSECSVTEIALVNETTPNVASPSNLVSENADFGSVLNEFASRRDAYDLAAVAAAMEQASDEIQVDSNAITSRGDDDDGCFVLGWLYVNRTDMQIVETSDEPTIHTEEQV